MLGKGEDDHTFVRKKLLKELKAQKESYTMLYRKIEYFNSIHAYLILCVSGHAPEGKWMCFSYIGHLIKSAYNRVCIDFTRYGFS